MITEPIPLLGGKSVFCINEEQMRMAKELYQDDLAGSAKIEGHLQKIRGDLSRNEQAALAFMLIDRLKTGS